MDRVRLGIVVGTLGAACALGACALDEAGTFGDAGGPDVVIRPDGGPDVTQQDVTQDVSYDVPDLGVGETESGLPCTCVSSVPSGYTIVEYVPDQRPPCSTGYGTQKDYVENPTAAASTCSCTCGSTPSQPPFCACGNNPATFDIASGNGNCTDVTGQTLSANLNTCYKNAQTLTDTGNKLNNMLAAPATACTAFGGACGPPTKVQNIPAPTSEQGRACTLTASTSTCSSSGTCIPTQGSGFGLCVTNFTMDTCTDPNFPVSHVVGTGVSDTRSCGPSTCTACTLTSSGTCGTPQLNLYIGDNNCGSNGSTITLPADGTTCTAVGLGNGATFDSAKYTVSQSGGTCAYGGTFTAQGTLSVSNGFRVCCHP